MACEKLYLIPEDVVETWRSKQRMSQVDQPKRNIVMNADSELRANLNNERVGDWQKNFTHSQLLGKYLNARAMAGPSPLTSQTHASQQITPQLAHQAVQQPLATLEVESDHKPVGPGADRMGAMLQSIPLANRRQAQGLLDSWARIPGVHWDDRLTLTVNGQPVSGSNVIDLARHAVSRVRAHRKTPYPQPPPGFDIMRDLHTSENLPRSLINNPVWLPSPPADEPSEAVYVGDRTDEEGFATPSAATPAKRRGKKVSEGQN